ncbi:FhaA domain-containing protein [Desulforamulus reducens]|nr:DUF3662 and FHA domain-containing protein [Desulforamulus reducens]
MRFFSALESSLEKYIEGFFKEKFSSDALVQPTDIAKKLARAMRDKRRISVTNVYVPNEYDIILHTSDYSYIQPMVPLLTKELVDFLVENATEKKFTLVSVPILRFLENEDLKPGDIIIESKFGVNESGESVAQIPLIKETDELEKEKEETRAFEPLSDTAPLRISKIPYSASLLVEEGNDMGKEFPLGDYRSSIGRRDTCDIVLNDSSISRRHAQIEKKNNRFCLSDLNSTNGTYVNGIPIDRTELTTGDVITLGNTVLVFKEL